MKTHFLAALCLSLPSVADATARRRLDMEGAVTDLGYDPYATAWRYLGAYVDDCSTSRWYSSCSKGTRRLLWAAYRDPSYEGDQIGEYKYYADGAWDSSTCVGDRCARMDCHDPDTEWELLGVYRESVSFQEDNFFEQLFKHQGYCLWDGDKEDGDYDSQDSDAWQDSTYRFMQAMRQELPEGCTQANVFHYYGDEGTYYVAMKPQAGGDMTLGVYTDSKCTIEAMYTYADYQKYAASSLTATASSGAFDTWNANMDAYKICQPCRAYNREETECSSDDCGQRRLGEENDGQGDEEQNGFNCYDDAGYQNCNQCYKFETHTDMEEASASDLSLADSQGTILLVDYKGVRYGNGYAGRGGGRAPSYTISYHANDTKTHSKGHGAAARRWLFFAFAVLALAVARRGARRRGTLDDEVYVEMPPGRGDADVPGDHVPWN